MLKNYFKTAWRSFWKHRSTGFINIAGLSVGMAAAVLIFIWVHNEFTFDDDQPDAENVYRITSHLAISKNETWVWESAPYQLGLEAKKTMPEVVAVTRVLPFHWEPMYLSINNEFFKEENAAYIDESWFNVFKTNFVSGNAIAFNQNPFSIILSESKAKKYFANQDAVGKIIRIDSANYQVQAVVKDAPANSSFKFDLFIPIAARQADAQEKKNDMSWGNFSYITFLKFKPGTNIKQATENLKSIIKPHRDKNDNLNITLRNLKAMHFESDLQNSGLVHAEKKVVYIFVILGALLLIIACINYVNLTTARASLRAKEVSIKKIVGAGRGHLFNQFVAESAVISVLALVLTVIIVSAALPSFNSFTNRNFSLTTGSAYLWLIMIGTLLLTIILNSIYPAVLLSSFKPLSAFRGGSVMKIKDTSLRKGLVVLQFTFSIFLIIGVITIYKQLSFVQSQNPGYDRSQIMSFNLSWKLLKGMKDDQKAAVKSTLKQAILQEPFVNGVSLVGMESIQSNGSFSSGSADWEGRPKDFNPSITYFNVDGDYNKLVNINFTSGRWFFPGSVDKRNVIINETAAKQFNLHKPYVGQRFIAQGDTGVVVGVVKDFNFQSMHAKITPVVFKLDQQWSSNYLVKVAPHKQAQAIARMESIWKQNFPDQPFSYQFLDQEFDKIYREDAKASTLMSGFAVVAIIISCLGLFGLAAFTAEQRGKEIGIRKVLGASIAGLVSLLSVEFVVLVLVALVIAAPLAYWLMNLWLQNFAYRISMQWWIFMAAGFVAVLIAFATVGLQTIKAAMANPVKSLRSE
ncbi:FtsX-like permease family protein [Mucilaginibacter achroorhodeus]|uniref:FtsX-like permease family protein n=1 Tax=Mucilaginibacter achroorhodeus TaxID=2599294 RepID=A0A563U3X4_9SPHI|nr:ABC transporter permease [Mucilaginibacter achroorhodeus]TWR26056.1 FtsX-like permease family protein [Mucilaginibacter achroorhodeus]